MHQDLLKQNFTKEQICERVDGYRNPESEAFNRMFERDKETLKSLGIDITIAPINRLFDDEVGYQITEKDYAVSFGDLSSSICSNCSKASALKPNAAKSFRRS